MQFFPENSAQGRIPTHRATLTPRTSREPGSFALASPTNLHTELTRTCGRTGQRVNIAPPAWRLYPATAPPPFTARVTSRDATATRPQTHLKSRSSSTVRSTNCACLSCHGFSRKSPPSPRRPTSLRPASGKSRNVLYVKLRRKSTNTPVIPYTSSSSRDGPIDGRRVPTPSR